MNGQAMVLTSCIGLLLAWGLLGNGVAAVDSGGARSVRVFTSLSMGAMSAIALISSLSFLAADAIQRSAVHGAMASGVVLCAIVLIGLVAYRFDDRGVLLWAVATADLVVVLTTLHLIVRGVGEASGRL